MSITRPVLLLVLLMTPRTVPAEETLHWRDLPALPSALGLGGPIVGVAGESLVVAGGANFPFGPPWPTSDSPPGRKVWHDHIHVLEPGAAQWLDAGRLPRPLAYAAAVSTADGIYVLGGETYEDTNRPSAEVLLIQWNAARRKIDVTDNALPPLPRPSQYHQAAVIDDVIYVLASHTQSAASRRLDAKAMWSLDLKRPSRERHWQPLPPWPGSAREKMSVAVQHAPTAASGAVDQCLFLFSGENWYKDASGRLDPSKYEAFTDAYRFHPQTTQWTRIADLPAVPQSAAKPRPAIAAAVIPISKSRLMLFSGANHQAFDRPLDQRPSFPPDVLTYDTARDVWTIAGQMPVAVVTTSAVHWSDRIVIPSGEVRPGVRTNRVQSLSLIAR